MEREKSLQHCGKEVKPAGFPSSRVEFELHVDPAAKGARAPARRSRAARGRCDPDQGVHCGPRFGDPAQIVELQHLTQGRGPIFPAHQRQMAKRKMRHEPPKTALTQRRTQRRGRREYAGETGDGGQAARRAGVPDGRPRTGARPADHGWCTEPRLR